MTLQDLIDTISEDPSQVREALELIKRQIPAYPEATEAADADFIPLTKAGGGTEKLPLPILDQRSVTPLPDITALRALGNTTVGQRVSTAGTNDANDGGACDYIIEERDGTRDWFMNVHLNDGVHQARLIRGVALENLTVLIPTDYPNKQAAIDDTYTKILMWPGARIDLVMQSGYEIAAGLLVSDGDYSHYLVSSEDPEVFLSDSFVGVAAETTQPNSLIAGKNARMPTLGCLINAADLCNGGYVVANGSSGWVLPRCGVRYANTLGLYAVNGSTVNAYLSDFSFSNTGSRVTTNSHLHGEGANFSNSRGVGLPASSVFGLDVSRGSTANIMSQGPNVTDLSNSAGTGLSVRRSFVSATGVLVDGAGINGISGYEGSHIIASGAEIYNVGNDAINCSNSFISAADLSVENPGLRAVRCSDGGKVCIGGATLDGSGGHSVQAVNGGEVVGKSLSITNSGGNGVDVNAGGIARLPELSVDGAIGRAIHASSGSEVVATSSSLTNIGLEHIRISRGSRVYAEGATVDGGVDIAPSDTNVGSFYQVVSGQGYIFA